MGASLRQLCGILAAAQFVSRSGDTKPVTVRDVLAAANKAYEIQGVLALDNAFNRVGIDHVLLVKVASAAVVTAMLGGSREQIFNAVSNAWLETTLRTYRHAPNTGSRKSWAAGDATSRGVRLAMMAMAGEMGYDTALSAPGWGFESVWFGGNEVKLARPSTPTSWRTSCSRSLILPSFTRRRRSKLLCDYIRRLAIASARSSRF